MPLEWDVEVSRSHASMIEVDGSWVLIDDGRSHNGSFVNGQRVDRSSRLKDGDILRFGETLILYRSPVATDVLARGRMDPGRPPPPPRRRADRRVPLGDAAGCCSPCATLVDRGSPTSGAAADEEIAKQLSLEREAVRENLWALSHVFDTEELPEDERWRESSSARGRPA